MSALVMQSGTGMQSKHANCSGTSMEVVNFELAFRSMVMPYQPWRAGEMLGASRAEVCSSSVGEIAVDVLAHVFSHLDSFKDLAK